LFCFTGLFDPSIQVFGLQQYLLNQQAAYALATANGVGLVRQLI
jgi:hypothetical protein